MVGSSSVVSDIVSSLGHRAASLYSSALDASPEVVKSSVSRVETLVTPYGTPVLNKWREHGEPLIAALDNTVATQIVRAKAVEQTVTQAVTKSEDYLKASVQLAHEKVVATETYVAETVLKPVTDAALRNKNLVEQKTRDTLDVLLTRADQAVDRVLPEVSTPSSSPRSEGSSDGSFPARLTKKVADRLYNRASEIYTHNAERAKKIVHIDLIAYAKATLGADEKKLSQAFDSVIRALPTPEGTRKLVDNATERVPKPAQPAFKFFGTRAVSPVVSAAVSAVSFVVLFIRAFILTPASEQVDDLPQPSESSAQENKPQASHVPSQVETAPISEENVQVLPSTSSVAPSQPLASEPVDGAATRKKKGKAHKKHEQEEDSSSDVHNLAAQLD